MSFTFISNGAAVGQETGGVWKFKEISRVRFNTPNLAAPHAIETWTLNTHLIGPGSKVKIKLALHMALTGQGIEKVVINTAKGPCGPT